MTLQYVCPLCPYETRARGILYRHLLIHTGVKPYCCENCGRRYALPETLLEHMAAHRREPPYKCGRCTMALDHFSEYLRHQVYHMLKSIHRCSFCGEGFVWKQALKHHSKTHKEGKHLFHMFFRKTAGRRTSTRYQDENDMPLDLKMKVPVQSGKGSRDCPGEMKTGNGLSRLGEQDRSSGYSQQQSLQPPPFGNLLTPGGPSLLDSYFKFYMYPHLGAPLPYQNGASLLSPVLRASPNGHEDEDMLMESGLYICRVCGWQFTKARYLRAHLLVHRRQDATSRPPEPEPVPKRLDVPVVSPVFQASFQSMLHTPDAGPTEPETAESPESSGNASSSAHRCPICQKGFSQPYKLRRHLVIHASPRIHQCNICQKVLPSVTELRSHKKLHGRARQHCCEYCKKDFSCSSTLRRHVRIHTGEKPYQCEVCLKRFSDLSNKNCHMRTHTGEKPHRCQVCGMRFSLKNALSCHMRNHMV
ncbi:zinc finger protein 700 isoform X2 [Rhipicephalus sanguineus]|uniref:zinc finger protein 700 isoform X2 n=1 Tax=Rhipicephalus sanguineus TaxID=34632 RepID=UPI001892DE61|nr:zinc finger protein 700 isoform X2 [Rhipicephalus sanguineus]